MVKTLHSQGCVTLIVDAHLCWSSSQLVLSVYNFWKYWKSPGILLVFLCKLVQIFT